LGTKSTKSGEIWTGIWRGFAGAEAGARWGEFRRKKGRFANKNRRKSRKIATVFEAFVLMLNELSAVCTDSRAANFFL
jgi:hypothetical protein